MPTPQNFQLSCGVGILPAFILRLYKVFWRCLLDISNKESLSAGRMPTPQELLEMSIVYRESN
jgi:hypothetical protein